MYSLNHEGVPVSHVLRHEEGGGVGSKTPRNLELSAISSGDVTSPVTPLYIVTVQTCHSTSEACALMVIS
jgi:hypothetical protein